MASGDPFLVHDNHTYRITELVLNHVDARYQLEECDPRERQRWQEEQAAPPPEPEPEPKPLSPTDPDNPEWQAKLAAVAERAQRPRITLRQYAMSKGWLGKGRLPISLREAYEREFGVNQG